jgi:hypothetical protein
MNRNLFIIALASSVILFTSCKKGDDGQPGATGTANVKYSSWFTADTWKKDTVFSVWGFNYFKPAPSITQQVIDSGTVLVFGKLKGYNTLVWPADQVGQLPITLTYNSGGLTTDTWAATSTAGNLKIRFINDKNTYASISVTHQFRYIIIPGGLPIGRGRSLSYGEICGMYGIPE